MVQRGCNDFLGEMLDTEVRLFSGSGQHHRHCALVGTYGSGLAPWCQCRKALNVPTCRILCIGWIMLPLLLSGAGLELLLEAGHVGSSHNTKGHKDKGRVGASGA